MAEPFLKTLLRLKEEPAAPLSCNDWLAVIELLKQALPLGIKPEIQEQAARRHLTRCHHCHEQLRRFYP